MIMEVKNAHWKWLGTLIWGVIIFIIMMIVQVIAVGVWFGLNHQRPKVSDFANITNGNEVSVMTILTALICSCVIIGVIKLKKGSHI